MLFNSYQFVIFFALFFLTFFALRNVKAQVALIVCGSLYFYSVWKPEYVLLVLVVTAIAYAAQVWSDRKYITFVTVAALLAILFVFKYYNFFAQQMSAFGFAFGMTTLLLPVGISFYVFHAISYVVDRKHYDFGTISMPRLLAYIVFFPQLVAGPIIRASVFLPQLKSPRIFNKFQFSTGMALFCMGMFKKLVIADNLGVFVDQVYMGAGQTTAANHWLGFYLYAFQIYYDFCGYSEMAIGISRTLGFKFPKNFNRPYLSASITEFWRRWHISLSSWLRDYLYFSLGGNRKGAVRTYINLALVMLLGGLWHGAAWTFVVWGAIHGLMLAIERLTNYQPKPGMQRLVGTFVTFNLVCISWVFFRSPDFNTAAKYLSGMLDWNSILDLTTKFSAIKCMGLIFLAVMIEKMSVPRTFVRLRSVPRKVSLAVVATALFLLLGNFSAHPFIYFQF
ncbi:MAG: MBOAT family protein [Betaproteobacteria bacterium]|nr:MBOAT family protein [Betaproteobacteria bacterium]